MIRFLFLCALVLLLATLATADTPVKSIKPFKVGSQSFDFKDPKQTNNVAITIDSPLEPIVGVADGVSGSALFDPDNPKATTGTMVVSVASLRFSNEGYTQTARNYGLNEEKYPDITCKLKKIGNGKITTRTEDTCVYQGSVTVDFTCKGITKTLTVPLKVTYLKGIANQRGPDFEGDVINVRCDFVVKRSDFGIAPEVVPNLVTDEIGVRVSVVGIANKKKVVKPPVVSSNDLPLTVEGKTYTLAERMAVHKVPACTVVLIKGGKVARVVNQGEAAPGRKVTAETLFPVGSMGHPLLAAAVLRASQQGLVDLDRDINTYLKSWKVPSGPLLVSGRGVTVRDLITQRSGFTYHKYMGYGPQSPLPTITQVLNGQKPSETPAATLATAPGSTFDLAMENWSVLQQVTEDISGRDFNSVMKEVLFESMGMTRSRFVSVPTKEMAETAAVGYDDDGKPLPGNWRAYPEIAASGMWTTPTEFAEAVAELFRNLNGDGTYLKKDVANELLRPLATDKTDDDTQTMAFGITKRNGEPILFRGGNPTGYYCQLFANVARGNAVIVFTNRNLSWRLTNEIRDSVDWQGK